MNVGTGPVVSMVLTVLTLLFAGSSNAYGQTEPVVLQGGRILTVANGVVENGSLVMQNGRITAVGPEVAVPPGALTIDVSGKTLMPGLIDGFTNLGTADYASFGEDDDEATNPVTPHMRVIDGFNPSNRFIPLALASGVTAALSAPAEGNLITGQSALVQLDGSTTEQMVEKAPVGVHVSLGEAPKVRYGAKNRTPMTRMGNAALLRQTLVDAQGYADKLARFEEKQSAYEAGGEGKKPNPVARDLKLEALLPVIRGDLPLLIAADRFDDIYTALRITAEFNTDMVLFGGAEAHRLAPELAERGVSVVWGPATATFRELEAMQGTLETPALLSAAGIRFAFQTGSVQNVSGLFQEARSALAGGLSHEEALRGLTLYPAMIFGVEEDLGSLETGKSADILVLDGDPLHGPSQIEIVFVSGRRVESVR